MTKELLTNVESQLECKCIQIILMPIAPKISAVMQKEYQGQQAVSIDGKVIAFGKNSLEALKNAKKIISDIENKDFVISKIYGKYVEA